MLSPLTPCSLSTLASEFALLFSSLYVSFSFSKITAMLSGVFSTCSSNTRLIVFAIGYSLFVSLKSDSICFCSSSDIISITETSLSEFSIISDTIFEKCFENLSIVSFLNSPVLYSIMHSSSPDLPVYTSSLKSSLEVLETVLWSSNSSPSIPSLISFSSSLWKISIVSKSGFLERSVLYANFSTIMS
ncbi:MAG: hypothetical protein BWY74_02239 [Firmicutes bacterium ADurb.Bin419]|nr:MAG: hypothetical protein BWY74_02239 [Firmicutes bacterium ADurb.Bin419]